MSEILDPSKEVFYDGMFTIISEDGFDETIAERKGHADFITLCPEYDEPLTLEQIQLNYPDVMMVIYEEPLRGYVFRFGNHRVDGKKVWEKAGKTNGFA